MVDRGSQRMLDIPCDLKDGRPVKLGIDEAGRGPVLGPMVYAAAFWRIEDDEVMSTMGFNDSKQLEENQRAQIYKQMTQQPALGCIIHIISAVELSAGMLRREPCSLNTISHDAARELVSLALKEGVNVTEVYVDTVGDPQYYQKWLRSHFEDRDPPLKVTVAKKADSLYKVVSAASIAAKVTRDRVVTEWQWLESFKLAPPTTFGSGYPSDSRTANWINEYYDNIFGFPSIVRFSWATAKEKISRSCVEVDWGDAEEDSTELLGVSSRITAFLKQRPDSLNRPRKRAKFFQRAQLQDAVGIQL